MNDAIDLFDRQPLEISGFRLLSRRIEPVGTPTLAQWAIALGVVQAAGESAPFWVGDLWNYAETQDGWREELPQALADHGLDFAVRTLHQYGYVARHVVGEARASAQTFKHAAIVADLPPADQVLLLQESATEGLSSHDLARLKRHRARPTVLAGQAALDGLYRVLYADPPWSYTDNGVIDPSGGAYARAEGHYPSMTMADLCALPVDAHALPDAVLFLWTTAPMLLCNPGPREVIEAWGFTPKTGMVWDKVLHNFGHYVSVRHEHLIVCTRGSCLPDAPTPMPDSVQTIRRSDVHSEKPQEFRQIIETLYTTGPYLELFGRRQHPGWSVMGNDARLWTADAEGVA